MLLLDAALVSLHRYFYDAAGLEGIAHWLAGIAAALIAALVYASGLGIKSFRQHKARAA